MTVKLDPIQTKFIGQGQSSKFSHMMKYFLAMDACYEVTMTYFMDAQYKVALLFVYL